MHPPEWSGPAAPSKGWHVAEDQDALPTGAFLPVDMLLQQLRQITPKDEIVARIELPSSRNRRWTKKYAAAVVKGRGEFPPMSGWTTRLRELELARAFFFLNPPSADEWLAFQTVECEQHATVDGVRVEPAWGKPASDSAYIAGDVRNPADVLSGYPQVESATREYLHELYGPAADDLIDLRNSCVRAFAFAAERAVDVRTIGLSIGTISAASAAVDDVLASESGAQGTGRHTPSADDKPASAVALGQHLFREALGKRGTWIRKSGGPEASQRMVPNANSAQGVWRAMANDPSADDSIGGDPVDLAGADGLAWANEHGHDWPAIADPLPSDKKPGRPKAGTPRALRGEYMAYLVLDRGHPVDVVAELFAVTRQAVDKACDKYGPLERLRIEVQDEGAEAKPHAPSSAV
jgi:hypothetical protein